MLYVLIPIYVFEQIVMILTFVCQTWHLPFTKLSFWIYRNIDRSISVLWHSRNFECMETNL